jgi:hypothetical protein
MSEAPEFQVVANLLALLADGKATVKKVDELRQTIERAETAAAKLAADREQHATAVAAAK